MLALALGLQLASAEASSVNPIQNTYTGGTTPVGGLTVTKIGGITLPSGAEISAFDSVSKRLFVTSNAGLQIVDLSVPTAPLFIETLDATDFGITSSDVSSVAVKNGIVAATVIAPNKNDPGTVVFVDAGDGTLLGTATVGASPDQLTFTPDGTKVLVANEGEIGATDPDGSVSIIDISGGVATATVATATFTAFNGMEATLRANEVRIFAGNSVSQDVEPEYIAVSVDGAKAMVTLQENNAVALLDIATATITEIVPLGSKNFSALLDSVVTRLRARG
jgi:DNA-binding beta-propeller fold protein YncE